MKPDYKEPIERLEKATGPDRDLGNEVLLACGWRAEEDGNGPDRALYWISPNEEEFADGDQPDPTKSIDAALTLVPEDRTFHFLRRTPLNAGYTFEFREPSDIGWTQGPPVYSGEHNIAAVAICIAALRARSA